MRQRTTYALSLIPLILAHQLEGYAFLVHLQLRIDLEKQPGIELIPLYGSSILLTLQECKI